MRNEPHVATKKLPSAPKIKAKPGEIVTITSELGHGKDDPKDFPQTARFKTIANITVGEELPESVKHAMHLGTQKKHQIVCECGPGVRCMSNPDCKCYQMAMRLAGNDEKKLLIRGRRIDVKLDDFYKNKYFCCGERCACTDCVLNPIEEAEKNISQKVRIVRKDSNKGFAVESKVVYKSGFITGFFTGKLQGLKGIKAGSINESYSLNVFQKEKSMLMQLRGSKIDRDYRTALENAYRATCFIDPLEAGNFTRFFNHSCRPNLDMIRVFHGGLSPADVRIVFVTNTVIPNKTEMTFDYGPYYRLSNCYCEPCLEKKNKKKKKSASAAGVQTKKRAAPAEFNEADRKKAKTSKPVVTPAPAPQAALKKVTVKNIVAQKRKKAVVVKEEEPQAALLVPKPEPIEGPRRSERLAKQNQEARDSAGARSRGPEGQILTRSQAKQLKQEDDDEKRMTRSMTRLKASSA